MTTAYTAEEIRTLGNSGCIPESFRNSWSTTDLVDYASSRIDEEGHFRRTFTSALTVTWVALTLALCLFGVFPELIASLSVHDRRVMTVVIIVICVGLTIASGAVWGLQIRLKKKVSVYIGADFAIVVEEFRWTPAQIGSASDEVRNSRAEMILHVLGDLLEIVEAASFEDPDNKDKKTSAEATRNRFGRVHQVFRRFGMIDKKAGWGRYVSRRRRGSQAEFIADTPQAEHLPQ